MSKIGRKKKCDVEKRKLAILCGNSRSQSVSGGRLANEMT
jgi:hypothetical protein